MGKGFLSGLGAAVAMGSKLYAANKRKGTSPVAPDQAGPPASAATPETSVFEQIGNAASQTWDRLKAGNIDDPSSEAYQRWGKGADPAVVAHNEFGDALDANQQFSDGWKNTGAPPTEGPLPNTNSQTPEFSAINSTEPEFEFEFQA